MAAAAEPVAETVLEATVATMRKIHLCKQAHQSAGAAHLRKDFGGDDIIKLATRGPEKSGMRLLTRPQSSPAVSRSAAVLGNRAAHNTGAGGARSQSHARLRPATALPKVGASLPSIGL